MNSRRLQKKIEREIIKNLGQNVLLTRLQDTNDTTDLDLYGEPEIPSGYTNFTERTVRIFVDELNYMEKLTTIGGMSDPTKEYLRFFISQSEDVAVGDSIKYPYGSTEEYYVVRVTPMVYKSVNLVKEVLTFRDLRT